MCVHSECTVLFNETGVSPHQYTWDRRCFRVSSRPSDSTKHAAHIQRAYSIVRPLFRRSFTRRVSRRATVQRATAFAIARRSGNRAGFDRTSADRRRGSRERAQTVISTNSGQADYAYVGVARGSAHTATAGFSISRDKHARLSNLRSRKRIDPLCGAFDHRVCLRGPQIPEPYDAEPSDTSRHT